MLKCYEKDYESDVYYIHGEHNYNQYGECIYCGEEALRPFSLREIQVCPKCDKVDVGKGHGCYKVREEEHK